LLRVRVVGVVKDNIPTPFTLSLMRQPKDAEWNPPREGDSLGL